MRHSLRQLALLGLMGLLAVALVTACGDETQPIATEASEGSPAPAGTDTTSSVSPTAASIPAPTAAPTSTPAPTAAPTQAPAVAPTPGPDTMPAMPAIEFSPDMRWGDLYDALSEPEQACISSELGDQLASVRDRLVLSEGATEPSQVSIVGCLSQETASELFLASFTAQLPPLPEESEACVRGLLKDADIAAIVASDLPEAGPAEQAAAMQFGFGLLTCLPEEMMSALMGGDGPGAPTDPTPTDDASLWRFQTGGRVANAPAVANGVVYAGSDDNFVYALDAGTGSMLWSFETGDIIRSTPTLAGGAVYVGSDDNHVYALNSETGAMLWKHDTSKEVQYSPVVTGGVVYIGAQGDVDYSVHALDAMSGEQVWAAGVPYPYGAEFAVTVANGKLYAPGASGEFYAMDASTGEALWSLDVGMGSESSPTVLDGVVYLTAVNTAYALNEATGEEIWSYGTEVFPATDHPAVVVDGVYYFAPDSNLYALDVTTGHMRWYYPADGLITDAPVVAEGMVFVRSESGVFHALSAATGSPVWTWETTDSALRSPTVVNGFLIAESADGNLRALVAATGDEVWSFRKGYFDGVPSYTIAGGMLYVGTLGGSVYAFAIASAG